MDNLLIRQFVDLVDGRNGKAERAGNVEASVRRVGQVRQVGLVKM